jgi:hypothetical protein
MALAQWEPFEGLTSLRWDIDRLFEDFMGRVPSRGGKGTTEPAVDVSATPEAVVVQAQMRPPCESYGLMVASRSRKIEQRIQHWP